MFFNFNLANTKIIIKKMKAQCISIKTTLEIAIYFSKNKIIYQIKNKR